MMDGIEPQALPATAEPPHGTVHHSQLLEVLIESAMSLSTRQLESMVLCSVEPSPELLTASPRIIQLEQFFHLNRSQSDTPNWWLYDDKASVLIERLAQRLRLAQYQAFSHAGLMQATVG